MAKVSRRQKAFELFGQGKKPGDPEIVALGLSPGTAKKYLVMWRKQKAETEQAPCLVCAGLEEAAAPVAPVAQPTQVVTPLAAGEVPIEFIPDGNLFEFKGLLYKKKRVVYSGQVIATRMIGAAYTSTLRERGTAEFKPGIMVTAK